MKEEEMNGKLILEEFPDAEAGDEDDDSAWEDVEDEDNPDGENKHICGKCILTTFITVERVFYDPVINSILFFYSTLLIPLGSINPIVSDCNLQHFGLRMLGGRKVKVLLYLIFQPSPKEENGKYKMMVMHHL